MLYMALKLNMSWSLDWSLVTMGLRCDSTRLTHLAPWCICQLAILHRKFPACYTVLLNLSRASTRRGLTPDPGRLLLLSKPKVGLSVLCRPEHCLSVTLVTQQHSNTAKLNLKCVHLLSARYGFSNVLQWLMQPYAWTISHFQQSNIRPYEAPNAQQNPSVPFLNIAAPDLESKWKNFSKSMSVSLSRYFTQINSKPLPLISHKICQALQSFGLFPLTCWRVLNNYAKQCNLAFILPISKPVIVLLIIAGQGCVKDTIAMKCILSAKQLPVSVLQRSFRDV